MGGPKEPALTVCNYKSKSQHMSFMRLGMELGQPASYQSVLDLWLRHRCSHLPIVPVHHLYEGSRGTIPCRPVSGEDKSQ